MSLKRKIKRAALKKSYRKFNKTWKALKRMDKKQALSLGKRPTFSQWTDHLEKLAAQAVRNDAESSVEPPVEDLEWDDE